MKKRLASEKSLVDGLLRKGQNFPAEYIQEPGVLVKLLRRRLGMTQNQLSKRSGVPQTSIANLEAGKKSPAIKTFVKLLEAMGFYLAFLPVAQFSPDSMIKDQAKQKAVSNLDPVLSSMAFEDQLPSKRKIQEMVKEEAGRLMETESARIWDE